MRALDTIAGLLLVTIYGGLVLVFVGIPVAILGVALYSASIGEWGNFGGYMVAFVFALAFGALMLAWSVDFGRGRKRKSDFSEVTVPRKPVPHGYVYGGKKPAPQVQRMVPRKPVKKRDPIFLTERRLEVARRVRALLHRKVWGERQY